jgi:transcriptional/translational regulatory protein YebC/TACO1
LVSVILEGYGPFGVPIIIEAQTDNKNRILGEIKLIFKNYKGALGESNSVMFQFNRVGEIELDCGDQKEIPQNTQLKLIDLGVIDFEENLVWVNSVEFNSMIEKIINLNLKIVRSEMVYKAINPVLLKNEEQLNNILDFIEELENNDDVLGVFAGFGYN